MGDTRLIVDDSGSPALVAWDSEAAAWLPVSSAQSGGGGSLLFTQAEASLTASFPWRAPAAVHFASATLTVAEAVADDVDVAELTVNGTAVATLALAEGQTTSTAAIDVDVDEGERLALGRLAADGGACQVQLDRGA